MLVAPVTTPGSVADHDGVVPAGPLGRLLHRGHLHRAASTAHGGRPLGRMPVFVRAGGIVPEQPSSAAHPSTSYSSLTVLDYPGASGSFSLYDDAGSGTGYTEGQFTTTPVRTSTRGSTTRLVVSPTVGHYRGQSATTNYRIQMVDVSRPAEVTLDGTKLAQQSSAGSGRGWSYDGTTDTVTVSVGPTPASRGLTVAEAGGRPLERAEPQLTPTATPG